MNPNPLPDPATPAEFRRDYGQGTVSGAQPKLFARKIGEVYMSGDTNEELCLRYDVCFDLVNQLVDYCYRKLAEHPEWSLVVLLEKVQKAVANRSDGDSSAGEIQWMVTKLSTRMNWPLLDFSQKR